MSAPPSDPSSPAAESVTPASEGVDYDIYCLTCGYNLRRLPGDPVRCPECGTWNALGQGEIPPTLIDARLRSLERAPQLCVAAAVCVLPCLWFLVDMLVSIPRAVLEGSDFVCPVLPLVILLALWISGLLSFRSSCGATPGWGRLIWWYHIYGVGIGGPLFLGLPTIGCMLWSPSDEMPWTYPVGILVLFAVSLVFIKRVLPRRYKALIAQIHELQRPFAITALRTEAQQRAAAPPSIP